MHDRSEFESETSKKEPNMSSTSMTFQPATRELQSILAPAEKRSLAWLAAHLPPWVNSDHLTVLGFAGMILTGATYYFAQWDRRMLLVGIVCLAINWFGDSLDGTLARYRIRRDVPGRGFRIVRLHEPQCGDGFSHCVLPGVD